MDTARSSVRRAFLSAWMEDAMFIPYPKKPGLWLNINQITAMEITKGRFKSSSLSVWLAPERSPENAATLLLDGPEAVAFLRSLAQFIPIPAEFGKAFTA